jgi:MFS family permease
VSQEPSRLRTLGRALAHRNYRLFFAGQSVSLIGSWLTRVATSWLVYRLTHSAALLGLVGFAGQIPTFFFAPFAGVWVDRLDRHRLLVITQVLATLQSIALAVLTIPGWITVWEIVALSVFQGLINSFDMPARQAFVVQMVDRREDLPNAIALNSSMVNAARLIGPSVAGVLIAWFGEGGCFAIDAASYLAVIASLLMMRVTPRERTPTEKRVLAELHEGFRYVKSFRPIGAILVLLAVVSLMGLPYTVLMPVIADAELHGGANTFGFLMAAGGLGALCGALYLASRKTVLGLGRTIVITAGVFGGGLIAFAASRQLWLSLVLQLVVGFGMMVQLASSNTVLQTIVEENKRGRVMAFYTMAIVGTAPFGSLVSGLLADRIGAPWTIAIGGAACILGAVWFASRLPELRELVRPIYVRLGILPEIAEGLQSASQLATPPED